MIYKKKVYNKRFTIKSEKVREITYKKLGLTSSCCEKEKEKHWYILFEEREREKLIA